VEHPNLCENMGLVAAQLLTRVLFSEAEDPKEFLRRMSIQAQDEKRRAQGNTPAEEWSEWDDLEDWQRTAVRELEAEEDTYFALEDFSDSTFSVNSGNLSFKVYASDDIARAEALDQVRLSLRDEPELFAQDWLRGFIDMEHLRNTLHQDARDDDYWNESYTDYDSKIKELIDRDRLDEDPRIDSDGNDLEITPEIEAMVDEKWEEMIEAFANERMKDPITYLSDIFGEEDANKWAFEHGRVNIDAAAESAINTDGWQHFLARYDGNSHDLPSGAVYVRT